MAMDRMLYQAVVLDSETLSLERGSGMYEAAVYDLQQKRLMEYFLDPTRVVSKVTKDQDLAKLVSSRSDEHVIQKAKRWGSIVAAQLGTGTGTAAQLLEHAHQSSPFLGKALQGRANYLLTGKPAKSKVPSTLPPGFAQIAEHRAFRSSIDKVLRPDGALDRAVRGKTIWIANANFEAKQFGSYIAGLERLGQDIGLRQHIETANPQGPDLLHVTGREVNVARVNAQLSGDWTGVWKAYDKFQPKKGETGVRDILDVVRSMGSYAEKLGYTDSASVQAGNDIDTVFRLFGSLEADPTTARTLMNAPEMHSAGMDAAIHENYVLQRAVKYTRAMQEAHEGTPAGRQMLRSAAKREGPLYEAQMFFHRKKELGKVRQRSDLIKRLSRAQEDMLGDGHSWQTSGYSNVYQRKSVRPDGAPVNVPNLIHNRLKMTDMTQVVDFLAGDPDRYGHNVHQVWDEMQKGVLAEQTSPADNVNALKRWVHRETKDAIPDYLAKHTDRLMGMHPRAITPTVPGPVPEAVMGMAKRLTASRPVAVAAGIMGSLAFVGAMMGHSQQASHESLVTANYEGWKRYNEDFYGMRPDNDVYEGMQSTGYMKQQRRQNTDFGSPYRGPVVSQGVLQDQEMIQQRENWMRREYGARHFDPYGGLFGITGPFSRFAKFLPSGYSYVNAGEQIDASQFDGIQGDNLVKIDTRDGWKLSVQDADTIRLKRGGIGGAIGSFFGMNKGYSFRLEGVDATETAHGSKRAQPYATKASQALTQMLQGKTTSIIFDPTNVTYGRQVGVLMADGRNVNRDLVARGIAAHLDFRGGDMPMIASESLAHLQDRARKNRTGMWAEPWVQAHAGFQDATGMSITFTTYAKKRKLIENTSLMNASILMNQAQDMGMYTNQMATQMANEGKLWAPGADNVAPIIMGKSSSHHSNYMDQMLADTARYTGTRGTGDYRNSVSFKSGYGKLDKALVLDSTGSATSHHSRPGSEFFEIYETQKLLSIQRKADMQREQRSLNRSMFQSPIGHHRM